jgi:ribonuclease Y
MEMVIAAALLAVGLVLAAVLYGRGRPAAPREGRTLAHADIAGDAELSARRAELVRIEERRARPS